MKRWKSLHIFLPRSGLDIPAIWELFCGPTPQMTELFISSGELSRSQIMSSTKGPASFPNLSSLEDLTLSVGGVTDLDFLPLTFPSVKRLQMDTSIPNSLQLSRFTNLESLDIYFKELSTNADSALEVVHLPLLRDLTLHVYGSTKVEWRIPILRSLTIIGWFGDGSKVAPTVRALHVIWNLVRPNYTTEIESSLLHTLQAMISGYGDMQKLSIPISLRPIWDKFVEGLSEEKCLALPTVGFDY
jgi:hypothetical protein